MMSTSIARILGIPLPKLVKILDRISLCGVSSREDETAALMNRRMVKDEHLRQVRAESGRLGGNPNLIKQNDKQKTTLPDNTDKQIPTPSSSPSSSSSISSSEEKKKAAFGLFVNVRLTEVEYSKLTEEFGEVGTTARIDNLSSYIASKGAKYKSHYATLLVWERKNGNGGTQGKRPKEVIPSLSIPSPEFLAKNMAETDAFLEN